MNGKTLLREEEEDSNCHVNIYVLSEVETTGSLNTSDNKLDSSAPDTHSEHSSEHEVQIKFMHF